jgi:hypothetical protein
VGQQEGTVSTRYLVAALAVVAGSALAQPQPGDIVFRETFDDFALGEDLTSLPNGWRITSGALNVIGQGGNDPWPGNGRYLDMEGTTGGPATLVRSFEVAAAGVYEVLGQVAGSSRANSAALRFAVPPFPGSDGTSTIVNLQPNRSFISHGLRTGVLPFGSTFDLTITTPSSSIFPGIEIDGSGLLDDVSVRFVSSIPETQTWVLLLAGLGLVAVQRTRRGRRDTTS